MSATFGTLSAFDAKEQTWEEYCEILDQFFEANDIDDSAKQRAILISVVGPATYKLMRNLVSPDKPSSKTYSQLVTRLKEHFNPKPSEIVQRYKFDSRSRKPAESRRLAQDCNFGATLERRLRDRLVCGIADDRIQRRLLSESDLTFEKAFQMAVADEAANRNVSDLQHGEKITVVGVAQVEVRYANQKKTLPLVVVKGTGPNLLGRGWLEKLKLKWDEIRHVRTEAQGLQEVLLRHEEVFKEELGMLRGAQATIRVSADAHPTFYKPRSVPYAMRSKVEVELERLLKEGIITPVKYAEWAAPIVPVLKPDGSVRICGDYKLTVNKVSSLEQYPIPRVEDLFNSLTEGKQFTKLDLSHAYQQIVMEEDSKKYLTINTHRGLFTYNRLPFGVSSAPAIFQRTMESLLQGLPQMLVSDNGTWFTSQEFEMFLKRNGIQHVTSAPFHPASNGLAERAVQTLKQGLKKTNGDTLETRLARFLFNYRITPQCTTGLSPAELLMSQRLRSSLDLLLPDIKAKVRKKQEKQKGYHDNHSKWRSFSPGDEVYVRNYSHGPKWVPAIILEGTGPVSYTVKMGDGRVMRRHVDQIKKRHVMQRDMDWAEARDAPQFPDDVVTFGPVDSVAPSSGGKAFVESAAEAAQGHVPEGDVTDVDIEQRTDPTPPVLRRSERQRKAPPYLSDFLCK
ncbi:uncharacterized protein K02A2.6-like [Xiphophorus maculatus]|uniref:uncharacterized protein K02A2.6-like n=1 Tax=Xiphophorus maculatus TaxID=8083 RepID=UPI000C6D4FFD|nr:uncharacterized protein K02A2.6-like [Xiphophorus maculatus]